MDWHIPKWIRRCRFTNRNGFLHRVVFRQDARTGRLWIFPHKLLELVVYSPPRRRIESLSGERSPICGFPHSLYAERVGEVIPMVVRYLGCFVGERAYFEDGGEGFLGGRGIAEEERDDGN